MGKKKQYELVMTDSILDNIYGQIGLTEVERKIEKLPLFKRLHEVSQLGLTKYIFPCAVHTRYVHSIGVMHTIYNMALGINMNSVKRCGKRFFTDEDLQILRLAGMLHDIGHYPLSHNIEAAYQEYYKLASVENGFVKINLTNIQKSITGCPDELLVLCDKDRDNDYQGGELDKYLKKNDGKNISPDQAYHHENIGYNIIIQDKNLHEIIRDNFIIGKDGKVIDCCKRIDNREKTIDQVTHELLILIGDLVNGNYMRCFTKEVEYKFERRYSAMLQLLHSDLDADNLDYLLHDATFSGTSYGVVDTKTLISRLTVQKIEVGGFKNLYLVGVEPKGIGCIEQYLNNKYLAYTQIVYSKFVSALESMLLFWTKEELIKNKKYGINLDVMNGTFMPEGLATLLNINSPVNITGKRPIDNSYLRFNDNYIKNTISSNEDSKNDGIPFRYIQSHLANFTSFELDKNFDQPEKIITCDEKSDKNEIKKIKDSEIYKAYEELIKKQKDKKNINPAEDLEFITELLSYRFETFELIKQIKLDEFNKTFYAEIEKLIDDSQKQIARNKLLKANYIRLANGIPIIENSRKSSSITLGKNGKIKSIPQLIVDSEMSSMHLRIHQRFICMRKYKVKDYN